jgi:nucleoside phosphorylase
MNKQNPSLNVLKPLLLLAHFGEAESLLSEGAFEKKKEGVLDYFENDSYRLLLSGEGKYNVLTSLTHFLAIFAPSTSKIVNLGLAASLEELFALEHSYFVRSSYQAVDKALDFEFKSFTTSYYDKPFVDCLSLDFRLLTGKNLDLYLPIASLVDREAWAIGQVCKYFSLPFIVRKTISDSPYKQATDCQAVMKNKKHWSDLIAQDFAEQVAPMLNVDTAFKEAPLHSIFSDKDFYFTYSMKNLWPLKSKFTKNLDELILRSKEYKFTPKERSTWLFSMLSHNSAQSRIHQELDRCFAELGPHVKIREKEDRPDFELQYRFKELEELEALTKMISNIQKEKLNLLLQGKIDVF